ncbi:hypothetical protein [Faecalibacterium prausnitzii]|uniref:hypothetical protein n=1 Tax=Faecalibacterium prausnitzii TaxID=853 RepID=UPI0035673D73
MDIKNSFLADAIATLADLGKRAAEPKPLTVKGHNYIVTGSGDIEEVEPIEIPKPENVVTRSLSALVALVKTEVDSQFTDLPIYISCEDYKRVRVFTKPNHDDDLHRWEPYEAVASDLPPLIEDVRWTFEEAQIRLRSMFQRAPEGETNDVDYILNLLSHMSVDQSVKSDDNGVTQTVQVRKGVSFVENQRVNPIVKLAPYRTFQEVLQPESEFVFRVYDDRSISLTAADGGMWKLAAREAVKNYLNSYLVGEDAMNKVIVTL